MFEARDRKKILRIVSILTVFFLSTAAYSQEESLWERYQSAFITEGGRIIDYAQGQISHSEGQGYGMLLAIENNDKEVFDKIWQWTKRNMGGRTDNLFVWSWGKRANGQWGIFDYNSATDGDILIAYALLKAAEKWTEPGYKNESLKIIESLRKNMSASRHGHTVLLPSYYGFARDDSFVLNPSYIIFPAFRYFAQADDKAFWEKVYKDGASILGMSCFGAWCLPADWVMLTDSNVLIYKEKNPYFGFAAIRTLLNLSGDKELPFPKGLRSVLDIYVKLGYIPQWIDLVKNSFSIAAAPAGFYAIYGRAAKRIGENDLSQKLFAEARAKLNEEKENYYSFSLYLFANSKGIF